MNGLHPRFPEGSSGAEAGLCASSSSPSEAEFTGCKVGNVSRRQFQPLAVKNQKENIYMKRQDRELHSQALMFWFLRPQMPAFFSCPTPPLPALLQDVIPPSPAASMSPLLKPKSHSDQLDLLPHHSFSKYCWECLLQIPVFLFLSFFFY